MKQNNSPDSIDHAIDKLLASKPIRTRDCFSNEVITALEHAPIPAIKHKPVRNPIRDYALPFAAVLALAVTLWSSLENPQPKNPLSLEETHEILHFEESLSALDPYSEVSGFTSGKLLATLETAAFAL